MELAERFLKRIFTRRARPTATRTWSSSTSTSTRPSSRRCEAIVEHEFRRLPLHRGRRDPAEASGKTVRVPGRWGNDLQAEHERYLTEEKFKRAGDPVHDYPAAIKPFYMRVNDDGKTVRAMDVLVPGVGEIIGGSQREERLDVLEARMEEQHLNPDDYWWYLDLRRYGTVPHAGFGLGLERMVQFVTGMAEHPRRDSVPANAGECGVLRATRPNGYISTSVTRRSHFRLRFS